MSGDWKSDKRFFSFEERVKYALIPPKLYLRNLAWRRMRRGEKELQILPKLIRPGCVAVDAGANKGLYSFLMGKIAREIVAFEPNPKMFQILKRCVPNNVQCHEVALSYEAGTAELILPIHHSGRFSNQGATLQNQKVDPGQAFETWPVTQQTLDHFDLRDVGFIKIDVEGFELELLKGAVETMARERPVLQIEIEERQNKVPLAEAIDEVCSGYGYDCSYLSRDDIRPWSDFSTDTDKTPTNNFIFRPKD